MGAGHRKTYTKLELQQREETKKRVYLIFRNHPKMFTKDIAERFGISTKLIGTWRHEYQKGMWERFAPIEDIIKLEPVNTLHSDYTLPGQVKMRNLAQTYAVASDHQRAARKADPYEGLKIKPKLEPCWEKSDDSETTLHDGRVEADTLVG